MSLDPLEYAAAKHAGQLRADGVTPYIEHPRAVVAILRRYGVTDPVMLTAAALHDVVEDCGVTRGEIYAEFGPYVGYFVDLLTNRDPDLKGRAKWDAQIKRMDRAPTGVIMVKLADILANLQDAIRHPNPRWAPAHIERIAEGAAWRARHLERGNAALAAEIQALAASVAPAHEAA